MPFCTCNFRLSHPPFQEGTSYDESNNSFFKKNHQNIRKKDKLPATAAEHPQTLRIQNPQKKSVPLYPQLTDLKFQIRNLQYIFPTQCDDFF